MSDYFGSNVINNRRFRYTDRPEVIAHRTYKEIERFCSTGDATPEIAALITNIFGTNNPLDVSRCIVFVSGLIEAKKAAGIEGDE